MLIVSLIICITKIGVSLSVFPEKRGDFWPLKILDFNEIGVFLNSKILEWGFF